jgi:hypothetical protein
MQLLLARRVNGHVLPDCVTFVAATNRRTDRAGVSGILEPVKSRFASIVELETDLNDWCKWAFNAGLNPILIAFLRYRSQLLPAFTPTSDLTNSPTPRTWANLARLEKLGLPQVIEAQGFYGAVGEAAANEYLSFRQMYKGLTSIDAILMDPTRAPIPTKPDELYATAMGLSRRATPQNFSLIGQYITRLAVEAHKGEFAVLITRDAQRMDPTIQFTDAYVRLQSGVIGQLMSGSN